MGRFLNSRASSSVVLRPPKMSTVLTAPVTPAAVAVEPEAVVTSFARSDTPIQTLGLYALCVYLIAAWANDLSKRFLGTKPFVSMIAGVVVFLCFLLSGQALAALRSTAGKLWLMLGVW